MKRFLAAVFGALVFGILVPIVYYFTVGSLPFEGLTGLFVLIGSGVGVGAFLGAMFPRVFGAVFEAIMGI